jgi:hydrogenase expression/formation protein HypD
MNAALFNDPEVAEKLIAGIRRMAEGRDVMRIMEVCGTHTMEIGRLGLRSLLPKQIELISGPGCPVCVTPGAIIDAAAELSLRHGVTVLSFGDMVRVPGDRTSLAQARASGGSVEIAASPLDMVARAQADPVREYVFVAVGFETTIPSTARAVVLVRERGLKNAKFLVCHRIVPPALDALIADASIGIAGFMLPGHVSAIIGERPYARLPERNIPAAITGFEPLDIIAGIHAIVDMIVRKAPAVRNMYPRVVKPGGNVRARELIDAVFRPGDALWRGIGVIPKSGLFLRDEFEELDAARHYGLSIDDHAMPAGCSCGEVLRGKIRPDRCPLFSGACTPEHPVGPCMVSSEGSCAAFFRYGG